MMRKFTCLLLLLTAIILNSFVVYADVIVEPQDDFYLAHSQECEYVNRVFVAAGVEDVTNVYRSPVDGRVVNSVLNGNELYVEWSWNDFYYLYDLGWVHNEDVSLVYDSIAFIEDHDIYIYDEESMSIPTARLYSYPNSGDSYELVEAAEYMLIGDAFSSIYEDENGLRWGHITYYMQHEGWICIDDPTNENFNSGFVPTEQSVSQLRGADAEVIPQSINLLIIATILVVIVVLVTVLMLKFVKKKAK